MEIDTTMRPRVLLRLIYCVQRADLITIQGKVAKFDIVERQNSRTSEHKLNIQINNKHYCFCRITEKHPNGIRRLCLTPNFTTTYANELSLIE